MRDLALEARRRPAGRDRPRGRAISANRSISCSQRRQARGRAAAGRSRRRDQGRRSRARADPRRPGRGRARRLATAACWWRSPRWRSPADLGVELFTYEGKLPAHAVWFGEDQGRYVVGSDPARAPRRSWSARRLLALPARIVGRVGGDALGAAKAKPPLAPRRAARRARELASAATWSHESVSGSRPRHPQSASPLRRLGPSSRERVGQVRQHSAGRCWLHLPVGDKRRQSSQRPNSRRPRQRSLAPHADGMPPKSSS